MIQTFFIQHSYLIGLVSFLIGLIGMPVVVRIAKAKGFVVLLDHGSLLIS